MGVTTRHFSTSEAGGRAPAAPALLHRVAFFPQGLWKGQREGLWAVAVGLAAHALPALRGAGSPLHPIVLVLPPTLLWPGQPAACRHAFLLHTLLHGQWFSSPPKCWAEGRPLRRPVLRTAFRQPAPVALSLACAHTLRAQGPPSVLPCVARAPSLLPTGS